MLTLAILGIAVQGTIVVNLLLICGDKKTTAAEPQRKGPPAPPEGLPLAGTGAADDDTLRNVASLKEERTENRAKKSKPTG